MYGYWQNGKIINKIIDEEQIEMIFKGINKYFLSFFQLSNYEEIVQIINEYLIID